MSQETNKSAVSNTVHDDEVDQNVEQDTASSMVAIGQWYWVKHKESEWLGCVTKIGSNYAEITEPNFGSQSHYRTRILFTEFMEMTIHEPNADAAIINKVNHYQQLANSHMQEVKELTARLGVYNGLSISDQADSNGQALVVMSNTPDINGYKNALIKAQKEDLPKLFEKIKDANSEVARWMSAQSMSLLAESKILEGTIHSIKDRVFNVSLYAGLEEEVKLCKDGEPAAYNEKLHVMQRRLYMDEECLLNYRYGGMEFKDIREYDSWIAEPENFKRILPFERCMVAMQVRRKDKEREWDGKISMLFQIDNQRQMDKWTFLYIRNGERLYRLNTQIEFDEMLFPDKSVFDPTRPMMVKMFAGSPERFITSDQYDFEVAAAVEKARLSELWKKENPEDSWDENTKGDYWFANPYRGGLGSFDPEEWSPVDVTNPYYDECMGKISNEVKKYNRVAIIIQGLFDRSEALHPHPPVKTWTQDGFFQAVELIYDSSLALTYGEAPDFEAYRAKCNASLKQGSVVVGQEDVWLLSEGKKESARLDRDYRNRSEYRPKRFHPYGNEGPGYLAKVAEWSPRARRATFYWLREKGQYSFRGYAQCKISVKDSDIFNADAYQLGDFKQFFLDPRTRANYLKWAPMLLAAEEYKAGLIEPQEPAYLNL